MIEAERTIHVTINYSRNISIIFFYKSLKVKQKQHNTLVSCNTPERDTALT